MSSIDTRLQKYWNFATCLHQTGATAWFIFLEDMAKNDVGLAQQAAIKLLTKRQKGHHESHTG